MITAFKSWRERYDAKAYDGEYKADVEAALLGRKVVDTKDECLILDDGTVLMVDANEGCGGCASGWFDIDHLRRFDNVITSVTLGNRDCGEYGDETLTIFVFADSGLSEEIVSVTGTDGNGYYGRGFELVVVPQEEK